MKASIFFPGIITAVVSSMIFLPKFSKKTDEIILPKSAKMGQEITHGDTAKKQVIFTFDGGATVQSAEEVLKVLAKRKIKGTFFLTGKMVETYPDLVRRIKSEGHEIFNHTYDHKDLRVLSDDEIVEELSAMSKRLFDIAGISPKPYFRAPYGLRNDRILTTAKKAGYISVYWTIDALDWREWQGQTSDQVERRVLSSLKPGAIFLMHLGDNITGAILNDVFAKIEKEGYKIVSLTEGL